MATSTSLSIKKIYV